MLKYLRNLSKTDWCLVVVIIGLTILQVWCTMLLVDYVSDITQATMYLSYRNASQMPDEYRTLFEPIFTTFGLEFCDWDGLLAINGLEEMVGTDVYTYLVAFGTASTGDIWWHGGMMVLVAFGSACCQILIAFIASYITANLSARTRSKLNDKIESFSIAEINKFSTASLVTRTTNDVQQVDMAILMMLRMVFAAPVTAIWALCKIQSAATSLTVATAVAIVVMLCGIIAILMAVMPVNRSMQKRVDRINGLTRENLTGLRVVRAYNAEGYQEAKFSDANSDLTRAQTFSGRVMGLMSPLMTITMNGLTLALYWLGAYAIDAGTTQFATIVSFTMLSSQIIMAFVMLLMMFMFWPRASAAARRINEVLETENTILDPEVEQPFTSEGEIEFRDVSFSYPDSDEYVLEHISFKASKGQTIAFIGSTGSGKSTLVNLVTRLYDVTDGQVLVDGVDVRDVKQETLRSRIGFVPQKGVLFSGTVKSNIGFGLDEISYEDAKAAAEIACADEFIEKMDGNYDAPIAQGGSNVSGGQKQRLCIARAVAIHPEFYVFDDSFSALDFKTDRQVRENLANSQKDATKLIVAQRIGTIMDADQIVVLSEGKMVGIGTHEELLQNCPTYRDIALSQLSEEELGL